MRLVSNLIVEYLIVSIMKEENFLSYIFLFGFF